LKIIILQGEKEQYKRKSVKSGTKCISQKKPQLGSERNTKTNNDRKKNITLNHKIMPFTSRRQIKLLYLIIKHISSVVFDTSIKEFLA
jgi:hypothetical protein